MENNEDLELEEQLAKLGVDLGNGISAKAPEPVQQVVQQPQQSIPQPYTPENPTNTGVVTNSIVSNTTPQVIAKPQPEEIATVTTNTVPVQQVVQEQENQRAQAQVVHTTTTVGNPVQQPIQATQTPVSRGTSNEVVFLDISKIRNRQKTPWLRLKDNEWSRVIFLGLDKVIPIKCHYIKGIGYVKCLSHVDDNGYSLLDGDCCSKYDPNTGGRIKRLDDKGNAIKPKNRYLIPIIEYPVDKTNANKLVPGQAPQLKMWNMNAVEWGDFIKGLEAIAEDPNDLSTADLYNTDFSLHKDPTGQFKTTSVNASPKCYRNDFADIIKAEEAKATKEFYETALEESMKVVSPETIINAYNREEAENAVANTLMTEGYGTQPLNFN